MTTTSSKPSSDSCPVTEPDLERLLDVHRRFLLPNLKRYKRPPIPPRPGRFTDDDNETLLAIRDARLREKKSETEKEVLRWFGIWRGDIIRYEAKCEGHILTLLRAANTFAQAGEESAAFNVLMFACTEYGFHLPSPETTEEDRATVARKYSRATEAMSDKILHEGLGPMRKKKQPPEPTQIQLEEVY